MPMFMLIVSTVRSLRNTFGRSVGQALSGVQALKTNPSWKGTWVFVDKIESFLCLVPAGAHNLHGTHKLLVAVMLAYLVVRGATLGSLFGFAMESHIPGSYLSKLSERHLPQQELVHRME